MLRDNGWCVYLHTVPSSVSGHDYDKYYVGITSHDPETRCKDGAGYFDQPFYNAIKKYGWKNLKHEILYNNVSREFAVDKEIELIEKYDSKLGHHGYNATDGGEGINGYKRKSVRNVYCVELKRAFWSAKECEKQLGLCARQIRECCNHKKGFDTCGGYHFIFVNEYTGSNGHVKAKAIIRINDHKIYYSIASAAVDNNTTEYIIKKSCSGKYKNKKKCKFSFMYLDEYLYKYDYT